VDFKQIEAFISVSKYKSFSKAANSVYLSQPAISTHIASLEKELCCQLFDRTSREVILTPAGISFLKYALEILNARDKAMICLTDFEHNVKGNLYLAASSTPCNTLVPSLVKQFENMYENVSFNVTELSSDEVIDNIINFDCELGIIGDYILNSKIKSYKLVEDELVIISHNSLKLPSELSIEALTKYKFILRKKGSATRKIFEEELLKNGFDPSELNVCCEVNNLDTLFQFVKQGIGISIVSSKVFIDFLGTENFKISKLKDIPLKRNLYLIISSKRTLTPTAKAFFSLCRNEFNICE